MPSAIRMKTMLIIASTALALSVGGCAERHLTDDFGVAMRSDLVAQIADPEPHHAKSSTPGSDGIRAAAAEDRYHKGRVIQPAMTATSSASTATAGAAAATQGPQQ